jgi:lycopene cyclase domain-containing protein
VSYTALSIVGVLLCGLVDGLVLRTNLLRRKPFWTTYAIVVAFQLIVNGILTGIPIVRYDAGTIIGVRVVFAPVEDLLFGFAMTVLTLSIWVWLGRRANASGPSPARPGPANRRS